MSEPDQNKAQEAGEIARLLSYVLLLLSSTGLLIASRSIPVSRFDVLGAGAFPMIVFALIALVSTGAIISAARSIPKQAYGLFVAQAIGWSRRCYLVFISLAAFSVYLITIPVLGFSIASFLFLFGLQTILMPCSIKTVSIAFMIALIFSFGLNWLFAEVFTVFLPRGVL